LQLIQVVAIYAARSADAARRHRRRVLSIAAIARLITEDDRESYWSCVLAMELDPASVTIPRSSWRTAR
jgi:hypothetical protein